jgi:hypothetical protein
MRGCRRDQKVPGSDKIDHVVGIGCPAKRTWKGEADTVALSNLTSTTINGNFPFVLDYHGFNENFLREESVYWHETIWYIQDLTKYSAQCIVQ